MFCSNCGADAGNERICPNCGNTVLQERQYVPQQYAPQQMPNIIINNTNTNVNKNENTNVGAGSVNSVSPKSKTVALILAIFLGYLGIHRFYVGKVGTGIIWFLTAGVFVFGWIYDIIKILSGTFTDGAGLVIRK